jgi:ATP-dependent RNA helicase SUPV3L1/SUV3
VTGGVENFDEELVKQLETHDFESVRVLQWRNADLNFASIDALRQSLEAPPTDKALAKVPVATDQHALEFLARNEAIALATNREAVELLWQCCQIPDYHGISPAQHGEIVTKVYSDLRTNNVIDSDWVAEQVRFCDNTTGDIDTLSNRIRQVRTWTFVANRKNWLADPAHWREKTRDLEDRLSDALHERLTQRFVDRRTSVLIRHLRDRLMTSPEINERGEVSLEGHAIGTIEGFRFTLARSDGDVDAKGLRAAADQVVAPEIAKRAERLIGAPNEEFVLSTDGYLRWKGEVVASLTEGDTVLAPRLTILADESLTGPLLERVQDRLALWLRHLINTQLESIAALEAPADLEGAARGIAFRLYESLGILPRQVVADEVKGLDQDVRGKMRKLGVKFGAHHIYVPMSLKPAPRELAIILFALKHGGVRQPGVAELPQMLLSGRTSFEIDPAISQQLYEIAGFKVAGKRAVRIDILERLADIIRPLIAIDARNHHGPGPLPNGAAEANGFRVTVEMTSLLGCAGEDFASILNSLGYRVRRTPKPAIAPEAPPVEAAPAEGAAPEAMTEAAAPAESAPAPDPTADDEDAAVNEAAMGAVEGAWQPAAVQAPPAEEAAAVDTATADLGAPAPDAAAADAAPEATAVDAANAEPQFDEVWFPAGRRPDNKRPPRRDRADGAPAAEGGEQRERRPRPKRFTKPEAPGKEAPQAVRPPNGDGEAKPRFEGKPKFEKGKFEKPKFDKPTFDKGKRNDPRPPRPPREPAYDPDSPFAALAALRNPKPE